MPTINDLDADSLISRLSRPLTGADREAFRAAAQDVLAGLPCWGEGAIYRAVASLQRSFRDPPSDGRTHRNLEQGFRPSRLRDGPPIGYGGDRRHIRYRKHAR